MSVFDHILAGQKQACFSEGHPTLAKRLDRLGRFERFVRERNKPLCDAIARDMQRPVTETYASEIAPVLAELRKAKKSLSSWMKPEKKSSTLFNLFAKSRHYPVPYGSALIIGPWNYPFGLLAVPGIHALAAGNRVILKPSEYAPSTTEYLRSALADYFDPLEMACVEGGAEETSQMIEAGPDLVFFTGGTSIGKKVMQSCAGRLTPVVLELGGSNPCIIDCQVNLLVAARRVAWGKFFNAGQTCLAPNACFVHDSIYEAFATELSNTIEGFYGKNPIESPDFGRIINDRHFSRLKEIKSRFAGRMLTGGGEDPGSLYLAPTVIEASDENSEMVQEEIFGPILPLYRYRDLGALLGKIRRLPPPLAVFCFTSDEAVKSLVREKTISGSLIFNGTLHLAASTSLPFGGVGESGMGRYHGKAGFDAFSYRRSEMDKPFRPDFSFIYPPYKTPLCLVRKAMNFFFH